MAAIELRDPPKARMHRVRRCVRLQESIRFLRPHSALAGHDGCVGHAADEAPLRILEVASIGEGKGDRAPLCWLPRRKFLVAAARADCRPECSWQSPQCTERIISAAFSPIM